MSRCSIVVRDTFLGTCYVPGFPQRGDDFVLMCCSEVLQGSVLHVQYTASFDESESDIRETRLFLSCSTNKQLQDFIAHRETHRKDDGS